MSKQKDASPPTLGICVTSRVSNRHVLGLTEAATRAGLSVDVFLTGEGVHVVRDPCFHKVVDCGRVSVCDASFRAAGLDSQDVKELTDKDFVTQWRNAEMVERCDRYIVL